MVTTVTTGQCLEVREHCARAEHQLCPGLGGSHDQGDVVTWAQEALLVYIYPAAEQQHNL